MDVRIPQDMPYSIFTHILENFLHKSKPMNYRSMVYVYGWIMEKHQIIGVDYQPIRDDDYIEDSMTQHYMELNDHYVESRF